MPEKDTNKPKVVAPNMTSPPRIGYLKCGKFGHVRAKFPTRKGSNTASNEGDKEQSSEAPDRYFTKSTPWDQEEEPESTSCGEQPVDWDNSTLNDQESEERGNSDGEQSVGWVYSTLEDQEKKQDSKGEESVGRNSDGEQSVGWDNSTLDDQEAFFISDLRHFTASPEPIPEDSQSLSPLPPLPENERKKHYVYDTGGKRLICIWRKK